MSSIFPVTFPTIVRCIISANVGLRLRLNRTLAERRAHDARGTELVIARRRSDRTARCRWARCRRLEAAGRFWTSSRRPPPSRVDSRLPPCYFMTSWGACPLSRLLWSAPIPPWSPTPSVGSSIRLAGRAHIRLDKKTDIELHGNGQSDCRRRQLWRRVRGEAS